MDNLNDNIESLVRRIIQSARNEQVASHPVRQADSSTATVDSHSHEAELYQRFNIPRSNANGNGGNAVTTSAQLASGIVQLA